MPKKSAPQARREAESTLKDIAEALGGSFRLTFTNGRFTLLWPGTADVPKGKVTADNLDDAVIAAFHKREGTEEAPF